ncbi:MAG: hypothetical protein MUC59_03415 [Saprospiraceae bacterium]|jgi:hypothetical protein|nr:hypothetical protein [Saprospiraceae bacterium]
MKNLIFTCLSIIPLSCCKNSVAEDSPSECLEAKLEEFKLQSGAIAIRTQVVNGETHYWLSTTAPTYDGFDSIINEQCDTVCTIGGKRIPPTCLEDYDGNIWEIIWEK